MWFWFHSAVQHESWVLVKCLFGLVKEVRRCTKKSGSNKSAGEMGKKTRTSDARLKDKIVTSINIQTSFIEVQAKFISLMN